VRSRRSSSKRPSSRPKARRPASASRGTRGAMGARRGPRPQCTRVEQRSTPPTQGACRLKNGSSIRVGKHGTAMPTTSSTLGGQAKRMREQQQATTLGGVDAKTAMKTARQHRNPRGPTCSAGRSAQRPSPSASASPRPLSSTTGRRIPVCGSTTNA
jgi:predicted component of type VI protein secretion system